MASAESALHDVRSNQHLEHSLRKQEDLTVYECQNAIAELVHGAARIRILALHPQRSAILAAGGASPGVWPRPPAALFRRISFLPGALTPTAARRVARRR